MIFTTIARIIAWLMSLFGALLAAMGFYLAFSSMPRAAVSNYIGSQTTGEVIDKGVLIFAVGIALGVLTDISKSVRINKDES